MSVLHQLDSSSGHTNDHVKEYCCFGIIVSVYGSSNVACNRLDNQTQKAVFKLRQLDTKPNFNLPTPNLYHQSLIMDVKFGHHS